MPLFLSCLSLAANVLLAGGVFTFPLLSPVLKSRLSQPQLTTIVLAGMAGQYPLTPLVGSVIDHYGPWLCSLIAAILFTVAFGAFSWQSYDILVDSQPPTQLSVYSLVICFALAGFATVFAYFSSLFSATHLFPRYPGAAAGTVMALFGLSPLILSFLASTFFMQPDASLDLVGFMTFLAASTGSVLFAGTWILPSKTETSSLSQDSEETSPLLGGTEHAEPESALALLRDPRFWALFCVLAATLGPCEMIMSNIGTVVLSLPPSSLSPIEAAALQVKILSISNTCTRLLTGPLVDFVSPVNRLEPRRRYISRAAFLVSPALVLAGSFLWMELHVRSQADIWLLSAGTGFAYGATFTVLPSIIASAWGEQSQARNFGIVVYAPLTGTIIFSYLYAFVAEHHTSGEVCGHMQYLTIQGLAIAWLTMTIATVDDVLSIPGLRALKRGLFIIAMPLATVVSSIYWTLLLAAPQLILQAMPTDSQVLMVIPLHIDLCLHAVPAVSLLLDFVLLERRYNRTAIVWVAPAVVLGFTVGYGWWVEHCAKQNGAFPYPFLTVNPLDIRLRIYLGAGLAAYLMLTLLNALHK
ncbi:MFS general substrate transporter [Mycena chlorophos]|uniref:MFS general substrate transporter n=1 Tax=Mycena chlorophos TaxID=658473 RepID=A0A8H6TUB2_MYCCL|nr:MFS general substrate transporter [Mycena chlorophos]